MPLPNPSRSTDIIIDHLRNLEGGEATIAGLKVVADRHASVIREQLRTAGDFQTLNDLPVKLLAASLQATVVEDFLPSEDTVLTKLAEVALEDVDWSEVAVACVKSDDDSPKAFAA